MFSLYNNKIYSFIQCSLVSVILILIQAYMPKIWLFAEFDISIDLFLIFLTLLLLNNQIYLVILYSFFLGLFQDFVVQVDMIGSYALIKPFTVYFLGVLKSFSHQWSNLNKMFYLLVIYLFHFLIYYYIMVNSSLFIIFILSIIQSLVCLFLFYIFEKLIYNSNIL